MPGSLPPEDEIARLRVENELLHEVLDCIGAVCRGGWPDSQKLHTIREAAEQYWANRKAETEPSHAL